MANSTRSAVSLYESADDDDDASDAYSMHMQLEDSQSHIATLLEMLSIENYAEESIQASSMINSMEGMLGRFSDNHYDIQNEMNEILESSRRGLLTHGQLSEMVSAEATRSQHLGNILNSLKSQIENMYDALNDLRSETESTNGADETVQQEIVHKSNQIVNKVDLIMKSVNAMDRIAVAPIKRLPNAIMNIDSEVVMHVNKTKLDQKEMVAAKRPSSMAVPPSGKQNQRKVRRTDSSSPSHGNGSTTAAPPPVETKSIGVGDCSIHDGAKPPEGFTPQKTKAATRNAFVQTTVTGSIGMESPDKSAETAKTSATTTNAVVSTAALVASATNTANAETATAGIVETVEGALSGVASIDPSPRNDGQEEHHDDDGSVTHDGTGHTQHKTKGGGSKAGSKGGKKKIVAKPHAGAGQSKGHHGGTSVAHDGDSEGAHRVADHHDEPHTTTKAGGKGYGRTEPAHSTAKPTHATNLTSQHLPAPIGSNTASIMNNTTSANIPTDGIVMTAAEIEVEIKRRVKLALSAAVNKDYFAFSSAVGSKSPHSQASFLAHSGRQLSGGFRDEEPVAELSLDKRDRGKRVDSSGGNREEETVTPTDIALQQAAMNAVSQKTGPIESEITAATTVDEGEGEQLFDVPEQQGGKGSIKPTPEARTNTTATVDTIITPGHRKSVTIADESASTANVSAADGSPGLPNQRKSVEGDVTANSAEESIQLADAAADVAVAVANGQARAAAATGRENLNMDSTMEGGAGSRVRGRYEGRGGVRTQADAPGPGSDEGFPTLEGPVLQAMPVRAAPPQSNGSLQYSSSGNPFLNSHGKLTDPNAPSGGPAGRIVVPGPGDYPPGEVPTDIDGLERDCAMSQISPCKSFHSLGGAAPSQSLHLGSQENADALGLPEGGQQAGKASISEAERLRRQHYFESMTDDLPDSPPARMFHNNSFKTQPGMATSTTTSSGPNKIDMFNQIFQNTTDPKKLAMIRIQGPESTGQRVHKGTCTSHDDPHTKVADSAVSTDENSLESAVITGQAMLPNVLNPISSLMNLSSSDILPSRAPPGHPAANVASRPPGKKPLRALKEQEINSIKEALAKALDAEACSFFLSELEHVLSTQHAADTRHGSPVGFELPVYDNQGDILFTRTYRMPTAPATFIEILSSSDNPLLYLHQEYSSFLSKMQRTRLLNAAVLEDRVKNDLPQSQSAQLLLSKLLENMLGTVTECNEMMSMVKECEQRVQGFVDLLRRKPEQLPAIMTSIQLQELFLAVGEIEAIKVCTDLKLAEYRSFLQRINAQSAYELDHLIRESTDFEYTYKHFIACQAKSLEVGQRLEMLLDRCQRHHLGSGRDKKNKKKKAKIDFDDQTSLGMGGPEAFHQEMQELQLEISTLKEQLATIQEEYEDQEVEIIEIMQEKDKSPDALLFFAIMHDTAYVNNLQQLLLQLKQLRTFADGNSHMDFITLRKRLQVCCVLTPNLEKLVDRYGTMYQKWSSFRLNWFSARKLNGGSADAFNSCPLCFQCIGSAEEHGVSGSPKKTTTTVNLAVTGMDRRHQRKQDQQMKQQHQQKQQQQLQVSRSQNFTGTQERQQQQLRLSLPHIK